MCWKTPVAYPAMLDGISQWKVAAAAIWNSGTVGRRLPDLMPATTVVLPVASVEVTVERSLELVWLAEMATSNLSLGARVNSASTPELRAFGTLKTRREEHEPAV